MTMRVALDSIGLPTSALRTADCELIRFRFPIENPNPHVHKDRQPGARGQAPDTANPAVSRSQLLGFKQTDPDFLGDDAADQSKLNLLLINTIIILLHPILTTMSLTVARERRSWTAKEDQLLRDAVHKGPSSSLFPQLSPHTPHRGPRQREPLQMACYCKTCPKQNKQGLSKAVVRKDGKRRRQRRVVPPGRRKARKGHRTIRHSVCPFPDIPPTPNPNPPSPAGPSSPPSFSQGTVIVSPPINSSSHFLIVS